MSDFRKATMLAVASAISLSLGATIVNAHPPKAVAAATKKGPPRASAAFLKHSAPAAQTQGTVSKLNPQPLASGAAAPSQTSPVRAPTAKSQAVDNYLFLNGLNAKERTKPK